MTSPHTLDVLQVPATTTTPVRTRSWPLRPIGRHHLDVDNRTMESTTTTTRSPPTEPSDDLSPHDGVDDLAPRPEMSTSTPHDGVDGTEHHNQHETPPTVTPRGYALTR